MPPPLGRLSEPLPWLRPQDDKGPYRSSPGHLDHQSDHHQTPCHQHIGTLTEDREHLRTSRDRLTLVPAIKFIAFAQTNSRRYRRQDAYYSPYSVALTSGRPTHSEVKGRERSDQSSSKKKEQQRLLK